MTASPGTQPSLRNLNTDYNIKKLPDVNDIKAAPISLSLLKYLKSLKIFRHSKETKREYRRIRQLTYRKNKHFKKVTTNQLPKITFANARSINNKVNEINTLLEDAQPEIALFVETWLTPINQTYTLSQIDPNNCYHLINLPRAQSKTISSARREIANGGLLMMLKKDSFSNIEPQLITPPAYEVQPWYQLEEKDQVLEYLIAKMRPKRLPRGYTTCLIVLVYLPHWIPKVQQALIYQLKAAIEFAVLKCTKHNEGVPLIYVAGDFNGANLNPILNDSAFKLHLINTKPTRKGKCLDQVLTNAPKCYTALNLPPLGQADHEIVSIRAFNDAYKNTLKPQLKRPMRTGKIKDTVAQIRTANWDFIRQNNTDLQSNFDYFYQTIKNAEDFCQPIKMKKTNIDKPWMTIEIKDMIKIRQKLYQQATVQKSVELTKYNEFAKKVSAEITKRKWQYNKAKTLSKPNWWKEIKDMNSVKTINLIDLKKASMINQGFRDVWVDQKQPDLTSFINKNCDKPKEPIFTIQNVGLFLKRLKSCSSGPDGLHAKLVKASYLELVEPLTHLYNQCIYNSFTPTQWKTANITPIPKIANPALAIDYRPIANLSTIDKIFQRVLAKYIVTITSKIWETNKQYGFLPGRSTMDAILQVIEDWSKASDQHKQLLAIFFDFEKAFDLVDHALLLTKLSKYLPDWLISWLASYLTERQQRVKVNGFETEWLKVEAGVIQGSVIGPILFILFIVDINDYLPQEADLEKYADDILSYLIGKFDCSLPQKIADGVLKWCIENKMRLNVKKCKIITLNYTPVQPIMINGEPLEEVDSYKYLGIELNNKLNWDQQWTRVKSITSSVPFLIKRLKQQGWPESILITIYRSHALSHFIYSAPTLTSASTGAKHEMDRFQKRILRIINITPSRAEKKYGIGTIPSLIDEICARKLLKILNDPTHSITSKLTQNKRTSDIKRRFRTNLAKTEAYSNSFVQKYLRMLRDGSDNLYQPRNLCNYNTTVIKTKRELGDKTPPKQIKRPKNQCPNCEIHFSNLASHLRLSKICKAQQKQKKKPEPHQ